MAYTFKHGDRPLEGYEIQRGVGRGGFGEVYYAISDGGREVALKYLRENPEVELRGISQCINLKSPYLVSIFDVKQSAEGDYFVIMEYISGPSLRDMLIAENKGLGTQKAAFFIREIAKGLAYLHDRGIVHRDLKPGNIFYEDGYTKICDYGLSKFISMSRHSAQTASIGTVHYMAPEVGSGNYSKTIDIYALGVMLYEMLLGKVPYEGASMGEILMKHLTKQPEVEELPQPFANVIRKALAKDPSERYQHVNEMIDAIFDVEDVKQSVLGFEPASLTMVAARAAEDIRPSPLRSDHPAAAVPPPPKRAFGNPAATGFSERFIERTTGLEAQYTKQERKKAKRQKRKLGGANRPELVGTDHGQAEVVRSRYAISFGRRLGRLFAASAVAAGLAFAIGVLTKEPKLAFVSFCIIMTSVVGLGMGTKVANWLGPDHPGLIGRIALLAFTAPAIGIVYGAVVKGGVGAAFLGRSDLAYLPLPLLAVFALLDWRDRIRSGARGDFSIWGALWPGFLGWLATNILMNASENAALWLGGIVASISLALQTFSWAVVRNPLALVEAGDEAAPRPSDPAHRDINETQVVPRVESAVAQARVAPVQEGFVIGAAGTGGQAARKQGRSWWPWAFAMLVAMMVAGFIAMTLPLSTRAPLARPSIKVFQQTQEKGRVVREIAVSTSQGEIEIYAGPEPVLSFGPLADSRVGGATWMILAVGAGAALTLFLVIAIARRNRARANPEAP